MPRIQSSQDMERMAEEIFELSKLASAVRARRRAGNPEVLSETEFVTIDLLVQEGPLTVGDIQKRIGVLPAQMSRIMRSLENKGGQAFVTCTINADDRRKVDVRVTAAGRRAQQAYRAARLKMTTEILRDLSPEDRHQFVRILGRIRAGIASRTPRA